MVQRQGEHVQLYQTITSSFFTCHNVNPKFATIYIAPKPWTQSLMPNNGPEG